MITSFILNGLDRRTSICLMVLVLIACLIPMSNAYLPAGSTFRISTDLMLLFGKYASFALLAVALDLVWGYCGILSLGHGAFFALGGYAMGMYLMRQIGTRGVYANPILPDFMVFLNWKELPSAWYFFNYFPYALVMVLLVPGFLAFIFGWFAFRSRVTGVYLSIITQAMTYALSLMFFRNDMGFHFPGLSLFGTVIPAYDLHLGFGGNNGLTDFKDILGFNIQADSTRRALFAASVITLGIGFWLASSIVNSKLGKVLIAIRDAESRTRFIGYRVATYKTVIFTVSACMAGVAGALYVPQVGIINPSEFSPANSIEAVIWVAVGGRGTLVGAIVGAVAVNWGKTWFTGVFPEAWLFALGALFVAGPLLLPKGIVGSLSELLAKKKSRDMYVAAPTTPEQLEDGEIESGTPNPAAE